MRMKHAQRWARPLSVLLAFVFSMSQAMPLAFAQSSATLRAPASQRSLIAQRRLAVELQGVFDAFAQAALARLAQTEQAIDWPLDVEGLLRSVFEELGEQVPELVLERAAKGSCRLSREKASSSCT